MKIAKFLGALLLVGALAGACGGDSGGDSPAAESAPAGGGGGGGVTLTAQDIEFNPNELSAAAGDTIDFSNEDDVKHSFTAEELEIDQDVEGGESISIDLGEAEAGTYDFICKYHPDMTGTLEITG